MTWKEHKQDFIAYLKVERALSPNTVEGYINDLNKLIWYCEENKLGNSPQEITYKNLQKFLQFLNELGLGARSQARIISGIKAFYKYLEIEDVIEINPAELLNTPRITRTLPNVLEIFEIVTLLNSIDLTHAQGKRNKAIIETLYGCGLRASELVNLKLSGLYFKDGFIKIIGKGNKERLIPIGQAAINVVSNYINEVRKFQKIKKGAEDFVFLNRNGNHLTRIMIYTIIKEMFKKQGIIKKVSPHTFRHSFATHLIEAGADLRAVQEMLGHESITTTEIYTHLDKELLRSAILLHHPRSIIQQTNNFP